MSVRKTKNQLHINCQIKTEKWSKSFEFKYDSDSIGDETITSNQVSLPTEGTIFDKVQIDSTRKAETTSGGKSVIGNIRESFLASMGSAAGTKVIELIWNYIFKK